MRWIFLVLASCCASTALAEPVVAYLDPPSLGRGKKNRLVLVGKGIDRAKDLWTTLPPGKLKLKPGMSQPERSEFEIDVAADCPLGIYGLRLATEDGLSNLHLFVVEDLAPLAALKDPQAEFPVSVAGVFKPETIDRYKIEIKEDGQRLTFDLVASRLGTDADPLVTIVDAEGRKIAERDNDPGLFFDCMFEHTFARKGIYTVEVRDSRFQGQPHWRYLLRIGNFPVAGAVTPAAIRPGETAAIRLADGGETLFFEMPREQSPGVAFHAIRRPVDTTASWFPLQAASAPCSTESEPNDTPEQASLVAGGLPLTLSGVLGAAGDRDHFGLSLRKGQRVQIRGESRPLNSAADLEMILYDPTGKEVGRADDANLPGGALEEGAINVNIQVDGVHRLLVRDMTRSGGPAFGYRVEVQPGGPRIAIAAEVADLTIPQGTYQILPLTVTRVEYTGPIVLALIGAPAGVKLEPSVIAEGENSVVCRVSTTTASPVGLHTLSLAAAGQAGETTLSARVAFRPLVDRLEENIDLIRDALRDNQRYLPPSVGSRLALQVTPPAPFGVDLVEQNLVLPRFLQVACPLTTTRTGGFNEDITFHATGNVIGEESQGRRRIFVRYPVAKPDQSTVALTFHSRSELNLDLRDRVEVTAIARDGARRIELKRSVNLLVKPVFEITTEPATLTLMPGQTAKVKLVAGRMREFNGPITINPTASYGITVPEEVVIPEGKASIEVDVAVAADFKPGRTRIRFPAVARVTEYQEEPKPAEFDLDVKAPPAEPKTEPKK